jgi:hypothetical protein
VPPTDPTAVHEQQSREARAQAAIHLQKASEELEERPNDPDRQLAFKSAAVAATKGDAMSVLSSFRFRKHPKLQGQVFSRISIDGALVTGNAAIAVASPAEATAAIRALSGADAPSVGRFRRATFQYILEILRSSTDPRAQEHLASLSALAVQVPETYGVNIYEMERADIFKVAHSENDAVAGAGADRVGSYMSALGESQLILDRLTTALADGKPATTIKEPGQSVTLASDQSTERAQWRARTAAERQRTSELLEKFEQRIMASSAYRDAARFALGI